jgi:hypothetical protein
MNTDNMRNMNRARKGSLLVSFILINFLASAQLRDGVTATRSFLDTIRTNYAYENSFNFDLYSIVPVVNIPVRVNIIMNRGGLAGVNMMDIIYSMDAANGFFKNAGLRFFIDTVQYINDYNYSFIAYNDLKKELLTKYAVNNGINLFLADTIRLGPDYSYGFTYFPDVADSNFIYLNKSYARGNYLTTMLGHYYGLLSTHETAGGRELADESNCSSSGDFICDTYADPDLFNEVIDSCRYIGTMRDDIGKYYIPSVANIMSESPDRCKCILTPLQYRRIYYYFHKYRKYPAS